AAGRGPVHTREDPDQRGLARAVVAQQARDLARLDLHAHVLERRDVAEPLRDTLDAQQRRAAVRRGAAAPAGRGVDARAAHADSATVRRLELFTITASTSLAPRKTWNQSAPTPAMPIAGCTLPNISAPNTAPVTRPAP